MPGYFNACMVFVTPHFDTILTLIEFCNKSVWKSINDFAPAVLQLDQLAANSGQKSRDRIAVLATSIAQAMPLAVVQ
jgi:hypothetical protein